MGKKNLAGITVSKQDDVSEWYTQLITKAELIDYTDISGCYVLRPRGFAIWERIQEYVDSLFKQSNVHGVSVQNAYFPLFIPESYLKREADHIEGFKAEVAWVTHGGDTELKEKLAIRPTSETIMYESYKKWIRSYRDLPLRLNQWCNVVRWEFKHPTPFLRSREFLWQEGHSVFATQEDADTEARMMLDIYTKTFEDLFAIPVIQGRKTEDEKFAGAEYTLSIETFMPTKKAIQCCTSHCLGQNFAKSFGIQFETKDAKKEFVYQNSWGLSTRTIGILLMYHSDDNGLVLPPKIAKEQVVLVPILFDDSKDKVLAATQELADSLKAAGVTCFVDDREDVSPGRKFAEWELKGIPLRAEIGPRDLENNSVTVAARDTGTKESVALDAFAAKAPQMLDDMQARMFAKAQEFLGAHTVECNSFDAVKETIAAGKMAKILWGGDTADEEAMKEALGGAKILNLPDEPKVSSGDTCVYSQKDAYAYALVAKSY